MNVGHSHPRVVEAIQEQSARFVHTDYTVVPYEGYIELAERLGALAPITGPTQAAFFNAGTEAVENAVKFARLATGRQAVIAFEGAFHGRTLLSLTMTVEAHPYKTGLGPFAAEVYRAPYPNAYRGHHGRGRARRSSSTCCTRTSPPSTSRRSSSSRSRARAASPRPAGLRRGSARALRPARDRPRRRRGADRLRAHRADVRDGALLVEPDLIVVAKSIAAGLPLSGVIGRAEIIDAAHDGAVGGTYIGNPVALAAALAVLDVFAEENLVARAVTIGADDPYAHALLAEAHPQIGDVRGLGAMVAIELVHDRVSKEPAPELASAVIDAALERGLILLKAGVYGNCIRVLCPLTIGDAELDEALAVWEDALASAVLGRPAAPSSTDAHTLEAAAPLWRSSASSISRVRMPVVRPSPDASKSRV